MADRDITTATNAEYDKRNGEWKTTRRMLTGDEVERELLQGYFEPDAHFDKRRSHADFRPYTRDIVSRLVGMLFQREGDVERSLGPLTSDDLASVGPDGEAYRVLLMDLAETLLAYNAAVLLVNPRRGLEMTAPLVMPRWTEEEAVITGTRSSGDSVFEDEKTQKTWTRMTPRGFEVYVREETAGGHEQKRVDQGRWAVNEDGEENAFFVLGGQPTAPVLRIEMPWEARFGYQVAKMHRAIYRMESSLDFAAEGSLHGLLQIGTGSDSDLADTIEKALKKGKRHIPYDKEKGAHKPIALPTEGVKTTKELVERKEESMYEASFQTLREAAQQSATEVAVRQSIGPASALSVVASVMEDAEERLLRLLAQTKDMTLAGPNPTDPGIEVSWPRDYSDVVAGREEDNLVDELFPRGVPADVETATDVVVEHLEEEGFSPDREAVRERVRQSIDQASQSPTSSFFG